MLTMVRLNWTPPPLPPPPPHTHTHTQHHPPTLHRIRPWLRICRDQPMKTEDLGSGRSSTTVGMNLHVLVCNWYGLINWGSSKKTLLWTWASSENYDQLAHSTNLITVSSGVSADSQGYNTIIGELRGRIIPTTIKPRSIRINRHEQTE